MSQLIYKNTEIIPISNASINLCGTLKNFVQDTLSNDIPIILNDNMIHLFDNNNITCFIQMKNHNNHDHDYLVSLGARGIATGDIYSEIKKVYIQQNIDYVDDNDVYIYCNNNKLSLEFASKYDIDFTKTSVHHIDNYIIYIEPEIGMYVDQVPPNESPFILKTRPLNNSDICTLISILDIMGQDEQAYEPSNSNYEELCKKYTHLFQKSLNVNYTPIRPNSKRIPPSQDEYEYLYNLRCLWSLADYLECHVLIHVIGYTISEFLNLIGSKNKYNNHENCPWAIRQILHASDDYTKEIRIKLICNKPEWAYAFDLTDEDKFELIHNNPSLKFIFDE